MKPINKFQSIMCIHNFLQNKALLIWPSPRSNNKQSWCMTTNVQYTYIKFTTPVPNLWLSWRNCLEVIPFCIFVPKALTTRDWKLKKLVDNHLLFLEWITLWNQQTIVMIEQNLIFQTITLTDFQFTLNVSFNLKEP